MKTLHIPPNTPLYVKLVDPQAQYDLELRHTVYETATGELLTLPRPAVVILNLLEPAPLEEIVIQKHWSGLPGAVTNWTIAPRSWRCSTRCRGTPQETCSYLSAKRTMNNFTRLDCGSVANEHS